MSRILSLLPAQEQRAGEFFPFSGAIELAMVPTWDLRALHLVGNPVVRADHTDEISLDWSEIDGGASLLRHELTHFFQGMVSPLIFEYALLRRFVYAQVLDTLVGEAHAGGRVELPRLLRVTPEMSAYSSLWLEDSRLRLSAVHILEALAIYHEFMHPDPDIARDTVLLTTHELKRVGVRDGLYDRILGSFIWDFGQRYHALFPLVAWSSLIPFRRRGSSPKHRNGPIPQFLELNEFLYTNPKIAEGLSQLATNRSRRGRLQMWDEWRDILLRSLKLEFEARAADVTKLSATADRMAAAIPRLRHRWEYIPQLAHLEALPMSVDELLPCAITLFVDDTYAELLDMCRWPSLIVRSRWIDVNEAVSNVPQRPMPDRWSSWQQSWHILEGFIGAAVGESAINECPHRDCPLHEGAMCATWRLFPDVWRECGFPRAFEQMTSVPASAFHIVRGPPSGTLEISLT